jgi:SAM-dependent methyltransferase
MKLNFGAGEEPELEKGWLNVDMIDLPGIDIVHNLMDFPYPFENESAEYIKAKDIIEHLDHYTKDRKPTIIAFIEEVHRILKSKGQLFIQTPSWDAEFLWVDPSHTRGFDLRSFDFFDPSTDFGKSTGFYTKAKFKILEAKKLENKNLQFLMEKYETD